MMHMTIYWGKDVILLINSWKTDSWTSYALTLLACFIFSIFYQHMEDRRVRFRSVASSKRSIETPLVAKSGPNQRVNPNRLISAVLFGFNSAIGYLLMLIIMSFNGGVLVAVVLGLTVGYYLFRSGDDDDDDLTVENACACS